MKMHSQRDRIWRRRPLACSAPIFALVRRGCRLLCLPLLLALALFVGATPRNSAYAMPLEPEGTGAPTADRSETVDGLNALVSLGDRVFKDLDNDGNYDPIDGEFGIAAVKVNLWSDDGDGVLTGSDTFITSTNTIGGGLYSFIDLADGDYIVSIDPVNFGMGGVLASSPTSTGNDLGDGTAPDPDDDVDGDDNGYEVPGFGVASKAVTLAMGTEPTDDGDASADSHLALDFGFRCPLCVGDLVFKDLDNDGEYEPGLLEEGIDGITVRLHRDADDDGVYTAADGAAISTTVTADGGVFTFCDLANGNYLLVIDASHFDPGGPLHNHLSSSGNDNGMGMAPDPDDDFDDDDNGYRLASGDVATKAFNLSCGGEPDKPEDGDGTSSNLTVDFGFECPTLSLGDKVFKDLDNDGRYEPGAGETGINGVSLRLWTDDDGNGTPDTDTGRTTLSVGDGDYLFSNLAPGDYVVQIEPANLQTGGVLAGMPNSTGNDPAPDPDDDVDNDDNGTDAGVLGVLSGAVTLGLREEPTDDGDGDDLTNRALDFGFYNLGPAISIQKTVYAGHDSGAGCPGGELVTQFAGNDVTYCFEVTNTGDTHLDAVQIDDADLGIDETGMTFISGTFPLAPDASASWYYEDVMMNDLVNTAVVSANPTDDQGNDLSGLEDPTSSDTAEVDAVEAGTPGIRIDKTVYLGQDGGIGCEGGELVSGLVGTQITYCFKVTNAGGTHLDTVQIDDLSLGIDETDMVQRSGTFPLAPGAMALWTFETSISGDLLNTAGTTANPVDDQGNDIPLLEDPTDDDTAEVDAVAPAITIDKTVYLGHDSGASCEGGEQVSGFPGADITYCFKLTNSGDTHLDAIQVDDASLGIDESDMTLSSGSFPLAPGAMALWYFETNITADLINTASASGNPTDDQGTDLPGLSDPSDSDTAEVDAVDPGTPAVDIQKTVYAGHDNGASCEGVDTLVAENGSLVTWCFKVTNTGATHLDTFQITDPDLGIDEGSMTLRSGAFPLAPGAMAVWTFEGSVDGDLLNTAVVTANPVDDQGNDIPLLNDPNDDDWAEVDEVAPDVVIQKTVYGGTDSGAGCEGAELVTDFPGMDITYCFKVVNAGDTFLNAIQVLDADLGIDQNDMTQLSGTFPLAPGAMAVWYYEDTITGDLINTASVTGNPTDDQGADLPGLTNPTDDDTAEVDAVDPGTPGLRLDKTVYLGTDGGASCEGGERVYGESGVAITWCFKITNTGGTHLDAVQITDAPLGIDQNGMTLRSGTFPLAPGAMAVWYFEDTLDADLDNQASASANPTDSNGGDIPLLVDPNDDDGASVDLVAPGIILNKGAYLGHDNGAGCGGTDVVVGSQGAAITYCFRVTNSGDTDLGDIGISDPALGIDQDDMTLVQGSVTPLIVGGIALLIYETTIDGDLLNTATASGNPVDDQGNDMPGVADPTDEDSAEVDEIGPAIDIQKTVYTGHDDGAGCAASGEMVSELAGTPITYCFEVMNTGDTHLDAITITDAPLGIDETDLTLFSGSFPLAPGASATWYYETTVSGDLTNTAVASGNPTDDQGNDVPGASDPSSTDTAEVILVLPPTELCLGGRVFKDLDNDGFYEPGDGENGVSLVRVNAYEDTNPDGVLGAGDLFVSSRITDVNGRYEFCGLLEGDYLVELDPVNMQVGARLNGMPTSTGNDLVDGTAPDPDDDVIDDDNGDDVPGFGIASKAITLGPGNEPPVGEDGDDTDGNQTLDFGVLCPLCLGDLVFKDLDDDGIFEPGDGETGIDGVRVNLYRDSDGSNDLSPGDEPLDSTTTADGGLYEFCDLADGSYIVEVAVGNFSPGAALEGHQSSIGNDVGGFAPDPDTDIDNDDNGDPQPGGAVASRAIDLGCGSEPDKPEDGDGTNGNRTLDFGFSCPADLCLGDLVFFDADDDGVFDPGDGEFGIMDVTLHLYIDSDASGDFSAGDTFVAETITDMFGAYGFCELAPGNYIVVIEPTNFDLGRILYKTESSRGNDILGMAPDPDDDVDQDDNGMNQMGGEVATKAITLLSNSEPDVGVDGDDTNGNQTLDLGLINILDPTAAEMTGLRVETGPDGRVTLYWSTASETDLAGFHVLRSSRFDGPYTRVSQRLIPGGDSRDGGSYRFVDRTDGLGTWFYRLEIVGLEGETEGYGPVMADFRRPAAPAWRIWLPSLMQGVGRSLDR